MHAGGVADNHGAWLDEKDPLEVRMNTDFLLRAPVFVLFFCGAKQHQHVALCVCFVLFVCLEAEIWYVDCSHKYKVLWWVEYNLWWKTTFG